MPRPSKHTPEIEELVRKRHAEGRSTYEIETEIGVPHQTISKWQRKWGLKAHNAKGPRATRARPKPPEEVVAEAQAVAESTPVPEELPLGDLEPLEELRRVDGQIRQAMENTYRQIGNNGSALSIYEKLAALRLRYVDAIASRSPKEALDPEKDPTNVEAAKALTADIERLVKGAEERARCLHCGKAPFLQ